MSPCSALTETAVGCRSRRVKVSGNIDPVPGANRVFDAFVGQDSISANTIFGTDTDQPAQGEIYGLGFELVWCPVPPASSKKTMAGR
jgi:hypothetical protein